jgi:hypothetical protein
VSSRGQALFGSIAKGAKPRVIPIRIASVFVDGSYRRERLCLLPNIVRVKFRKAANFSEVSRAAEKPVSGVGSFPNGIATAPVRFCRV